MPAPRSTAGGPRQRIRTSAGTRLTGSRSSQSQAMRSAAGATARARRSGGGYVTQNVPMSRPASNPIADFFGNVAPQDRLMRDNTNAIRRATNRGR